MAKRINNKVITFKINKYKNTLHFNPVQDLDATLSRLKSNMKLRKNSTKLIADSTAAALLNT